MYYLRGSSQYVTNSMEEEHLNKYSERGLFRKRNAKAKRVFASKIWSTLVGSNLYVRKLRVLCKYGIDFTFVCE